MRVLHITHNNFWRVTASLETSGASWQMAIYVDWWQGLVEQKTSITSLHTRQLSVKDQLHGKAEFPVVV